MTPIFPDFCSHTMVVVWQQRQQRMQQSNILGEECNWCRR